MSDNSTLPISAQTAFSLVLPEQLAQQAAAVVRELLAEAAAENTTRSYTSALRYWAGWHAARYGIEMVLPVPEATVLQFVVDHVVRRSAEGELTWELPPVVDQVLVASGLKAKPGAWTLSTVRHRVAVLSTAHRLKHLPNPCEQPAVRTVLSRAGRAAVKRGERPRKKTAITLHELEAMLATCDDTLEGIRDRALLCFAFSSGGRRRSEVAAADMRDLRRIGDKGYIYRLEHSKTQQAGVTASSTPDKPVLDRAALALEEWVEAGRITDGAIFRRLWKTRVGPALSPAAVAEIVQRRARLAGLEGDFGGHSLRSGFVTEASRQGVPLPAIMQMTEHRAVSSVVGYFQTGSAAHNPAARLLEDL
ncbi:site-specific integrase [Xanthomonas translucens pv. undulosa]|uniref:site-specific integrase n=2 Tax=Xanthomonas campestris pv. translucens TaxID=343 RepID=UPI0006421212|nr:site-specific integrase [Xanthomonas translucens]AKK67756.1 integrase [Xanthomonas translucens pv. undulosa]MCT8272522.1 site-specific integrase [Xanthomonas translucens pv. undulosa]QEO26515.1 tyrosine-type recombinase/integrase [Xanthomonas translucens pv. undulosa]QSQ40428.1 site-specific integrase [Xanthomonas translucens pv. translucens]QSQ48375.1 site-specific integrase [Xanthomonas translucens pv. undulosa]